MADSWVKLSKNIKNDPIFKKPKLLNMWIWCLLKANQKTRFEKLAGKEIAVYPGQFITSSRVMARMFSITTVEMLRKRLESLSKMGLITVQRPKRGYLLITINNWDKYCSEEETDENS